MSNPTCWSNNDKRMLLCQLQGEIQSYNGFIDCLNAKEQEYAAAIGSEFQPYPMKPVISLEDPFWLNSSVEYLDTRLEELKREVEMSWARFDELDRRLNPKQVEPSKEYLVEYYYKTEHQVTEEMKNLTMGDTKNRSEF